MQFRALSSRAWDHPRACGEHSSRCTRSNVRVGSSPRLRGTLNQHDSHTSHRGIIPALAGNTADPTTRGAGSGDHPRACGEHSSLIPDATFLMGSSPRLRGTRGGWCRLLGATGIIPALAGNTAIGATPASPTGDHPRACGEHTLRDVCSIADLGLSPRLRGTLPCHAPFTCFIGIIPALAGNTSRGPFRSAGRWDHPRACGEHLHLPADQVHTAGSSPRLRGTLCPASSAGCSAGIIPALAGNTDVHVHIAVTSWDHPRACGEHLSLVEQTTPYPGSSPRLRGTLDADAEAGGVPGIIPALAGNTTYYTFFAYATKDHPRACGEHGEELRPDDLCMGSSPRLRGTLGVIDAHLSFLGIIPALAGNTSPWRFAVYWPWDHPRACGEHSWFAAVR